MANLGFSLRSALGLIPKTDKLEAHNNSLKEEFDKLNSYMESEELKEFQELKTLVESEEFISNKKNILALNFKTTEEYQKENRFKKLQKEKRFVNYFKVLSAAALSEFNDIEASDELKNYLHLKEYLASAEHKNTVQEIHQNLQAEKDKAKQLAALSKSKKIKDYFKVLNSAQLKNYHSLHASAELDEYNELKEFCASQNLQEFKKAIAEQLISEKNKPAEIKHLKGNAVVKSYYKTAQKEEIEKPQEVLQLEELESYLKSPDYEAKLKELTYKNTSEFQKEEKFKSLQKDKKFKDYFKFIASPLFIHYEAFKDSDELQQFEDLKAYIASPDYQEALTSFTYKNTDEFKKETAYDALKKSSRIMHWIKFQKSKPYLLFKEIDNSEALKEYQELEEFLNSDTFKELKAYMLDKEKWQKTEEHQKEIRYHELAKSENIKWYFKVKDSKKFDELKAWNLTFEDDFTSGKVEDEKWMNSYFWGKMMINDRYVMADDKQYFTDNKNVELNGTSVKIVTKKEATKGKAWHPKHGFFTTDFSYTSGMLSTAHSFRQKYGRIEAKIRLNADYPVYQAFWLKGEKILPQVDIFRYNTDKKNRFQMINIWGDAANATKAPRKIEKLNGANFTKDYFIYTLDWTQEKLSWKINGLEVFSTSEGIPDEPLYLILSAGLQKEPAQDFTQTAMEIDWVRCYEKA